MEDRLMCFTPWDVQSKRQYSIEGVYPALNAGQGIGGQAHGVCYGIDSHPMDSRIRLQEPDEPVQTLSRKMYKGTADVPMVLIDKKSDCADTAKSNSPDRVFQNTGQGWWTESDICETIRTPCGGDAMKANLIVEERGDG